MEYIQNPKITAVNALPARSIAVPKGRVINLDGEYDFRYDGGEWNKLIVPSMWQYHGYGVPRYTNVDYPFPFNPPYINVHNPIGEYKRHFCVENPTENMILHFDGVDGAYYVYVNDTFAGFAKGSRNPHEFDVTSLIKKGENSLYIKVYTYSDASYLEAQDMFLASGIFRSVYLLCLEKNSIWDYTIKTTMSEIEVKITADTDSDCRVEISVDGEVHVGKEHTFKIKKPRLWNAEEPNLYEVKINLYKGGSLIEEHSKKVGLCEVSISGGRLCINNTPIRLKGVNRHEYVSDNGRAIDYETTKNELELLKKHHVNAIRCSHYPNNPFFYELCNEMGFYIVDEADLETHGCGASGDQGFLSKSSAWLDAYMDRVQRMYERDKNETCIIIWSVGNECGNGENLVKCAQYLKDSYITKPVLYPQDDSHMPRFTDFRQCGYCPVWALEQIECETDKLNDKPVIMTEYAHAMGNSPGALYDYWKLIYKSKTIIGGFAWEFKNHGFLKDGTYLYGGDFGEVNHAYNFNMDGFVFSDGTPKPAMEELEFVFSPIWCEYETGVKITNTNDFKSITSITWELCEDWNVIKSGKENAVIAPHGCITFDIKPNTLKAGAIYRVNIYCGNAKKQVELPYSLPKQDFIKEEFNYFLTDNGVSGEDFEIEFSEGLLCKYVVSGKNRIQEPMKLNFYRKPTDNDGIKGKRENLTNEWDRALLRYFNFYAESKEVLKGSDEVIFTFRGKAMPEGKFVGYFMTIQYRIYKSGRLLVSIEGAPYGFMPSIIPRIGVVFKMPRQDNVEWYGRGEHESYADRKQSAFFGRFTEKVSDMSVEYERPQENGNHSDTYFVNIGGISVYGCDTFEFTVHDYSLDSLMRAEHKGEIEKSDNVYLYIDYKNRGLGSASCGPHPEEQYELHPHSFRFVFVIKEDDGLFDNVSYGISTQKLSDTYVMKSAVEVKENFDCR